MRWWERLLPLVLLTLVVLLSTQSPNLAAQPRPDTNQQIGDRHPLQAYSPFEAALLKSLSTLESQQETRYREQKAADAEWWPPSPSWAVVYVTVAYVIVACFQWFTIRRQANIADLSIKITQRAALGVKRIVADLSRGTVVVFIQNFGSSAASDIHVSVMTIGLNEAPRTLDYGAIAIPDTRNIAQGELMPEVEFAIPIQMEEPLSDTNVEAINAKTGFLYVLGFVKYHDGFERRELVVRYYYEPGPPISVFVSCPQQAARKA
jgi:hypothetical protein